MRIRILFSVNNPGCTIPFNHQPLIKEYLDDFLIRKRSSFGHYSNFTFSTLKGKYQVSPQGLIVTSPRISLIFSSPNGAFVSEISQLLTSEKEIKLGGLSLSPLNTSQECTPNFDSQMSFICLSPIGIIDAQSKNELPTRFIPPLSDTFSDILYESTIDRMEVSGIYSEDKLASFNKFQLIPDDQYLEKYKGEEHKYSRLYKINGKMNPFEIRGYIFPFTLFAAPEVQEFIYFNGLGLFCNQGYGSVDFYSEPIKNTNIPKRQNAISV